MFRLTLVVEAAPGGQWNARFNPKVSTRYATGAGFAPAVGFGENPSAALKDLADKLSFTEATIALVTGLPFDDVNRSDSLRYPVVWNGEGSAAVEGPPLTIKVWLPGMFHVERSAAPQQDEPRVPIAPCNCLECQMLRGGAA
jgi:hypothetical protein